MERYDPINMPYTKAMIADKLGGYVKYEDHEYQITSLKEQLEKMTNDRKCAVQTYEDTKRELEEELEEMTEKCDDAHGMALDYKSKLEELEEQKIETNKNVERVVEGQKETIDLLIKQLEKDREDNDSLKKTIDKMHIFIQSLP